MLTQVSVTTQRAPATAFSGSSVSSIRPPWARAQSSRSFGGRSASGVARRRVKPNRTAASIQLRATLLPSPHQATTWPAIGPRCSSNVSTSAISWQGCEVSVSPLITGTVAYSASSCSFDDLVGAQHDRIDIARQHAGGIGRRFAAPALHVARRQHDHVAAQLPHADLERDAGAGGGLLEDQRQRLAGQRAGRGAARACSCRRRPASAAASRCRNRAGRGSGAGRSPCGDRSSRFTARLSEALTLRRPWRRRAARAGWRGAA